jgi:SAM-dependent methyltransferase
VLDVGAGPGFATADLGEMVGADGEVVGLERSARFVAAARRRCAHRGLTNVRVEETDLMTDAPDAPDVPGAMPAAGFDAAWCRWVACFVSSPELLVQRIARALRPGGAAIFHEYEDYATWRLLPPRTEVERFVADVMASWRATGGEPDIARTLPALLARSGFIVRHVRPIVFTVRPADFIWQWPAAFLRSGVRRLVELGCIDEAFAERVTREFDLAERDPSTLMVTPLVLEIVAERL